MLYLNVYYDEAMAHSSSICAVSVILSMLMSNVFVNY